MGQRRYIQPFPEGHRPRTDTLEEFSSSVRRLAKAYGIADLGVAGDLWQSWDQILGEDLAKHCSFVRFTKGELTVRASNPQWRTELMFMRDGIATRVNQFLGADEIKRVKIICN